MTPLWTRMCNHVCGSVFMCLSGGVFFHRVANIQSGIDSVEIYGTGAALTRQAQIIPNMDLQGPAGSNTGCSMCWGESATLLSPTGRLRWQLLYIYLIRVQNTPASHPPPPLPPQTPLPWRQSVPCDFKATSPIAFPALVCAVLTAQITGYGQASRKTRMGKSWVPLID